MTKILLVIHTNPLAVHLAPSRRHKKLERAVEYVVRVEVLPSAGKVVAESDASGDAIIWRIPVAITAEDRGTKLS